MTTTTEDPVTKYISRRDLPEPDRTPVRFEEWQAPTGRWLRPGVAFKVRGKTGWFVFNAFVDNGIAPHVECFDRYRQFRAVRPEDVYNVKTKPEEKR